LKKEKHNLQAGFNDDNGGGFATSTTTTMEEARVTEEAYSTADRWWRDETGATWKKEPLCSIKMAFRNGRRKNGRFHAKKKNSGADSFKP